MRSVVFVLVEAAAGLGQSAAGGSWNVHGSSQRGSNAGAVSLVSISVTPADPSQYNGSAVAFTATGTYSDSSMQDLTAGSTWSSSNGVVAGLGTLSATQLVNCLSPGASTIQAINAGVSGSTVLSCIAPPATSAENRYCGPGDTPSFGTSDGPAALPTSCIYTDMAGTPAPGSTVTVACGGSVQTALNNASCGQKIVLPAMCSGSQNQAGPITLPAHGCDAGHWIYLESDQVSNAGFPAEHARANPCAI